MAGRSLREWPGNRERKNQTQRIDGGIKKSGELVELGFGIKEGGWGGRKKKALGKGEENTEGGSREA